MQIKFKKEKNELWEFHFITEGEVNPISDDYLLSSNESLWQEILNETGENILFKDFFVTNGGYGFNSLLYQLVIYNIILHKNILLQCTDGEYLVKKHKLKSYLSEWKYEISNISFKNPQVSDHGYAKNTGDKYLVNAETFFELVNAMKISSYETTDVEFYSVEKMNRVGELLGRSKKPKLSEILEADDIFAALSLGEDLGYDHYILVKSKKDISPLIKETEDRANEFAKRFMKDYHNKKSIAEVHSFLCELIKEVFPKCYSMMK